MIARPHTVDSKVEMATPSSLLLFLAITATVHGQSCENADAEVLILGAGMSGIAAAKTLYDNGVTDFIILEQVSDCLLYVSHVLCQSLYSCLQERRVCMPGTGTYRWFKYLV